MVDVRELPWRVDTSTGRVRILASDPRHTIIAEIGGSVSNPEVMETAQLICRLVNEGPLRHETGMRIAKAIREQSDGSIGPVVDWSDAELSEIVTRVLAEGR